MTQLRIMHYKIHRTKSLAQAGAFRIAVLSDLHGSSLAAEGGLLRRQLHRLKPDLMLCCGDMITAKFGGSSTREAVSFLRETAALCPVYFVNGNHETRLSGNPQRFPEKDRSFFRELSLAGIRLLNNASALVKLSGCTIRIAGFEAALSYYDRLHRTLPDAGLLRRLLGEPSQEEYTIVLAHHPDFFEACSEWGADLTLSGHLHGGMVRLPGLGGVVGGGLLPFPRYDRGRFVLENGSEMIVSAGLGEHTIPVRWNNPPELVLLE